MKYCLIGHDRVNAVSDMLICLVPLQEHVMVEREEEADCVVRLDRRGRSLSAHAIVRQNGISADGEKMAEVPEGAGELERRRIETHAVKTALYLALLPHLESKPVWGSLTGVKPAKPVRLLLQEGLSRSEAEDYLRGQYFVSDSRIKLCIEAAEKALETEKKLQKREVQLYAGIPFCPAKCSYCSFVSNDIKSWGHMIPPYVEALLAEVEASGAAARECGLTVGSAYIGGGTPTTLTAAQLDRLIGTMKKSFGLGDIEFTVEAGRPETIDKEKLEVLASHGINRISINPQTMNDNVLKRVGRLHTAEDIEDCFSLARRTAPFAINMDLIAGLPGDTSESLFESVRRVAALEPENITIHCLARKKGAPLRFERQQDLSPEDLDRCYDYLANRGYRPYYIYRQKYMAGGLENVGLCKEGLESKYNICMMEELCDVIALGAGSVSKLCTDGGRKIVRIGNPKYPKEYVENAGKISREKRQLSLIFGT